MNTLTNVTVANASAADPATVQGTASLLMLKKAMEAQESTAAQLISALPLQPALAASGAVGTQLNTFA
jgi:hypothetical protein